MFALLMRFSVGILRKNVKENAEKLRKYIRKS